MAGTAAAGLSVTALPKMSWSADEEPELNFYNWDTYIGPDTLDNFEDRTGIAVQMDLYANNSELFAKLKDGNPGYDVIVPGNDWLERMVAADMIEPLDHSRIPNFKHLAPRFQDAEFDPGRKHSMPYMWGTIGIGYRKSRVDGVPDSWKWIFDSDKYSGRIALLRDCRFYMAAALKYLGHSLNTTDMAKIKEAEALVLKQKPHLLTFAPDTGQRLLIEGAVDLTMEWSGDIAQVKAEDPDLDYVVPKEGSIIWQDTLAIPKDAPHPDNAHRFINYILNPKVNASVAEFIRYATPNEGAKEFLPADYLNSPITYPPESALDASEHILYVGEDVIEEYEAACTRVFAG
jgi:spermidine/putrescine transport system substrate-binding protein